MKTKDRMFVIEGGAFPHGWCVLHMHRTYLREHGLPEEGINSINRGNKENKMICYKGRTSNLSEAYADPEQRLLLIF